MDPKTTGVSWGTEPGSHPEGERGGGEAGGEVVPPLEVPVLGRRVPLTSGSAEGGGGVPRRGGGGPSEAPGGVRPGREKGLGGEGHTAARGEWETGVRTALVTRGPVRSRVNPVQPEVRGRWTGGSPPVWVRGTVLPSLLPPSVRTSEPPRSGSGLVGRPTPSST